MGSKIILLFCCSIFVVQNTVCMENTFSFPQWKSRIPSNERIERTTSTDSLSLPSEIRRVDSLSTSFGSGGLKRKRSNGSDNSNASVAQSFYAGNDLDEITTDEEDLEVNDLFKRNEQPKNSSCLSSLCCGCLILKTGFNFLLNGGCCLLKNIISVSPEERYLRLLDFYTKSNQEIGIKLLNKENIVKGEGGILFFDLRESTKYWREHDKKDDTVKFMQNFKKKSEKIVKKVEKKDSVKFMRALTKHLFFPTAEKYNLNLVGTSGDGPLFVRFKKKSEKHASVISDTIRAGIELLVLYSVVKERNKLDGPENCGVGLDYGEFHFFLTPSGKNFPIPPVISSFVGEHITDAYFCEQSNKKNGTAMAITKKVYKLLKNKALKSIFTFYSSTTKIGKMPVYAANLTDLQNLYYKKKSPTTVTKIKKIKVAKKK